ncbi:MAG: arginine--tRNA ligase [Ktedonobacterales bacterium]|nr:arginine--tRNA ligase [Ktedonobacterales bacterium]
MIRDTIRRMITAAAATLHERGELELPADGLPTFDVERPQQAQHGDYATNLAMKLARPPKSREIATKIADYLNETAPLVPAYELVEHVETAGPGFINIRLSPKWLLRQAGAVIEAGPTVGNIELGVGKSIDLEFVSANPTGPVHIGNGRGGFIGDTLGNLLRAAGYTVTKEYYFNDAGAQIQKLGRSIEYYLRLQLGQDVAKPKDEKGEIEGYFDDETDPEDTFYRGITRTIMAETHDGADVLALPADERAAVIGKRAAGHVMRGIQATMARLNIQFDVFFNEASLVTTGELQAGIQTLRAAGYLYEREGATWMETSRFGDDKDRVLLKSDGETTYAASDVAYIRNKLDRGFDQLIYVLGADHHGYVGRLTAMAQMFGYAPDKIHVLIYQHVSLKVDGKSQRMSKRKGNTITLDELADLVGADVMRFFYLSRSADTHLDFDLALAMKEGEENPGLTVQYGHARIAGVVRKSVEGGFHPEAEALAADLAVLLADAPEQLTAELALIREVLRLEEIIERGALTLEPHHLTKYGMDVAAAFHIFYDRCPILRAESDAVRGARFALTLAARTVLARVLTLLGMDAPDRMDRPTE